MSTTPNSTPATAPVKIIKPDGSVLIENHKDDGEPMPLQRLQEIVEGYIEAIRIPGDSENLIICNEDGRRKKLPVNRLASDLAQQMIVGTIAVVPRRLM